MTDVDRLIEDQMAARRAAEEPEFYGDFDNTIIPGPDEPYYGELVVPVRSAVEQALEEEWVGRFGTADPSGL